MKEFNKLIKKVVEKVNLGIKASGLEGINFYSEDLYEAMYFYLESNREKEEEQQCLFLIENTAPGLQMENQMV